MKGPKDSQTLRHVDMPFRVSGVIENDPNRVYIICRCYILVDDGTKNEESYKTFGVQYVGFLTSIYEQMKHSKRMTTELFRAFDCIWAIISVCRVEFVNVQSVTRTCSLRMTQTAPPVFVLTPRHNFPLEHGPNVWYIDGDMCKVDKLPK